MNVGKIRAAAKAMKDEIGHDQSKARGVLQKEGVVDAKGDLTPLYRDARQSNAEFLYKVSRG